MNVDDRVWIEWDEDELEADAKWIAWIVWSAYPGHPWSVRAYKNGFHIGRLDYPDHWYMNCPRAGKIHSSSEYKKKIVMMAGEFLERGNILRGPMRDGEEMTKLEGVPEPKKIETPNVVINESKPRETLMPQVHQT